MDSKQETITVIRPITRWEVLNIRQIFAFKDLLKAFGLRDIKLRYRQTALGVAWVLLQPIIAAGVMSFVFNRVAGLKAPGNLPYFLFCFAGMLGWNVFNSTLTKAAGSLILNTALVSKVYFPKALVPLSSMFASLVDLAVATGFFLLLLPFYGVGLTWQILLTPVWVFFLLLASLGIGLYSSALMVSYRDVQYILPVVTNLLYFATPIAFSLEAVPSSLRWFVSINPLTGLLEGMRWSLLGTGTLEVGSTIYSMIAAVLVFVAGSLLFGRSERRFADVI
ncbi:MAG: ABC transporter permease [Fimbriimonadaceae bacterium]|nr:ABC transporter permease [Fimbriimonadaceae bacterium]